MEDGLHRPLLNEATRHPPYRRHSSGNVARHHHASAFANASPASNSAPLHYQHPGGTPVSPLVSLRSNDDPAYFQPRSPYGRHSTPGSALELENPDINLVPTHSRQRLGMNRRQPGGMRRIGSAAYTRVNSSGNVNANMTAVKNETDLDMLQGKWRTSSGQVAHVTNMTIVFTYAEGNVIPPLRSLATLHGKVSLMGVPLVRVAANCVIWEDSDVWTAAPDAADPAPERLTPRMQNLAAGSLPLGTPLEYKAIPPPQHMYPAKPAGPPAQAVGNPPVRFGNSAEINLGSSVLSKSTPYSSPYSSGKRRDSDEHSFDDYDVDRVLKTFVFDPTRKSVTQTASHDGVDPTGGSAPTAGAGGEPQTRPKRGQSTISDGGETHTDPLTSSRRFSSTPQNLLGKMQGITHLDKAGRAKARRKIKGVLCCCFKPKDVGDQYVDFDDSPKEGDDGRTNEGGYNYDPEIRMYVRRLRGVLNVPVQKEMTEKEHFETASVVYKAFNKFPDVRRWKKQKKWNIILMSISDPVMKAAFTEVAARPSEPKVAPSMEEKVRILELWWAVDQDASGSLDSREVRRLMGLLNVSIKANMLKQKIKEFDSDGNDHFDFVEFTDFYDWLRKRYELRDAHEALFKMKAAPPVDQLRYFLVDVQKEKHSDSGVKKILQEWKHDFGKSSPAHGRESEPWDLQEFSRYVMSAHNTWWSPDSKRRTHDLSQPITHYFINSSHNTYLTGDQLMSDSNPNMYTYALLSGCRCVEVDCYDGPDGLPIVYHGYTKTSKISFEGVIEAIHRDAFTVSDLPVIISLEIHTSEEQQTRMAEIMKRIFGETLHPAIAPPLEDNPPARMSEEYYNEFHTKYTPLSLRKKILLKGPMAAIIHDEDETEQTQRLISESQNKQHTQKVVSKDLSECIFFRNTKLRPGGPSAHTGGQGKIYECTSLSEVNAEKLVNSKDSHVVQAFAEMNKNTMTRIYPKGTRIDSTNLYPYEWVFGSQLIAFNVQTPDFPIRLNRALFQQNGNCGYLLKPERMRKPGVDPLIPQMNKVQLTITIISAGNLPKPNMETRGEIIDPFVRIMIAGGPNDDTHSKPFRTKMVDDNGFNPVWKESYSVLIHDPEMAIVTLRVMDGDSLGFDDFIGEASCPLLSIREV